MLLCLCLSCCLCSAWQWLELVRAQQVVYVAVTVAVALPASSRRLTLIACARHIRAHSIFPLASALAIAIQVQIHCAHLLATIRVLALSVGGRQPRCNNAMARAGRRRRVYSADEKWTLRVHVRLVAQALHGHVSGNRARVRRVVARSLRVHSVRIRCWPEEMSRRVRANVARSTRVLVRGRMRV
jgi:hypothetical protein